MQKRASRRSMNSGRTNEEQQTSKVEDQENYISQKNCNTDSLIADMAQGFIQAQANTANTSQLSNRDVISLLEKVNNQLEEIKKSSKEKQNAGNQAQDVQSSNKKSTQQKEGEQSASSNKEKTDQELLKQLKELVGATLQEKGKNENSINTSSKSQNDSSENSDTKNQQQSMPAQMASQVLAQAQYELANELENSLEKLKQVIKKSEKVATNISNLLGEENKKKS